jgi:hypothetical protein
MMNICTTNIGFVRMQGIGAASVAAVGCVMMKSIGGMKCDEASEELIDTFSDSLKLPHVSLTVDGLAEHE